MNTDKDNRSPEELQPQPENTDRPEQPPEQPPVKLTVYDLLYGVLFEPVKTFRIVAQKTPLKLTLLLVLTLNLLLAIMDMYALDYTLFAPMFNHPHMAGEMLRVLEAVGPMAAVGGFITGVLWWFFYAGFLHLLAEFYGGRGSAVSTFTVYGLAGLPAVILIPMQLLEIIFSRSATVGGIVLITTIAVKIWGIVLLAIGLREVHRFSTGKAVAVIVTPWGVALLLGIIATIIITGVIASILPQLY